MKRAALIQMGTPAPAFYKGILMRANPALHEEAFALLHKAVPAGARVIDVGCGQGAFTARLRDHGYVVTAVDKNADDFRAEGLAFVDVDFDVPGQVDSFMSSHRGAYDAAIGMEVIEHVENPWEYCRTLLSLVRPGGLVFITTPNAGSVLSRVDMLFSGLFAHFTRHDYETSGHINPLTFHELHLIADGVGADVVEARSICRLPWLTLSRRPSTIFRSAIAFLLRPFLEDEAKGDIICFILKKTF